MNKQLKEYIDWLKLNYDSDETIRTYFKRIQDFYIHHNELNQETLNAYFLNVIKKKNSNNTFNSAKTCFLKYLQFSKQTLELPKWRKKDKPINRYISREEIQEMLKLLDFIFEKEYIKVGIIVKLFFATGMRCKEFLKLKRKDIDLQRGIIELLNTKGNRDRLVPLGRKLKKEIELYFDSTIEGRNAFNITFRGLQEIFKKINNSINPKVRINPRLLRHSSAVNMVREGVDLFSIKNILGHSDIRMTEIYAEPDFKHTKEIYNKCVKEL